MSQSGGAVTTHSPHTAQTHKIHAKHRPKLKISFAKGVTFSFERLHVAVCTCVCDVYVCA